MAPISISVRLVISLFITQAFTKSLWSTRPATNYSALLQHAYPVGNGRLAALPYGEPGAEKLSINRDNLWWGGPFANTSYKGGNGEEKHQFLPGIRDWIWQNGTGNVSKLMGDTNDYGSYQVLANLSVEIDDIGLVEKYNRSLDLVTGIHTTKFQSTGVDYEVKTYCSYPHDVCVYDLSSSHALPAVSIYLEQLQANLSQVSTSCAASQVRLRGVTQVDPSFQQDLGMRYESTAKVLGSSSSFSCDGDMLKVHAGEHKRLSVVLAAGTDYNQTRGTPQYDYSFQGDDPAAYVSHVINTAASFSGDELLSAHIADYSALANAFVLELANTLNSSNLETSELIARYANPNTTDLGDPYLESLMFDYGRHLFIASGRDNSLPPNLQGRWANALENAWSADYHANINLQMNYWHVEQTGLGELTAGLWNYMVDTWAPRGAETAKSLYDAPGWVVHDEMNIFAYTAMKEGDDQWANYPASAAWMMQHVYDHFDYSQDLDWLKRQGYPTLLKPIAEFWLSQLQNDEYFNDGTLVVNPCDSPEHPPTTFGCTHWQQLIFQVFETTSSAATLVGEDDEGFLNNLHEKLSTLDKGLYIGRWGQIQEWKIDMDVENDTHRHLSHLVGWYPGWALSSYLDGYSNSTIQDAVETSLYSRGVGIGPDANAGWEKVWRAACWARLNNSMEAYYELRLTIYENWAPNGLSMYSAKMLPFQIDANFGFPGAVLAMLIVDLPNMSGDDTIRTVVLGPSIPSAWGGGSVKGLRLREGGSVNFEWDMEGTVKHVHVSGRSRPIRLVNKHGELLASI